MSKTHTTHPGEDTTQHGSDRPPRRVDNGQLLASAMSVNAIFSATTGIALVTGCWLFDVWLGLSPWVLAILGVGLLGFAALLLHMLAHPATLRRRATGVIVADIGWVVGAGAIILTDVLTPSGDVVLGLLTAIVGLLGGVQWIGLRRSSGTPAATCTSAISATVTREIDAEPERVWEAVAQADGYAAFADGIAETTVVGEPGEGMLRVCTDDQGYSWSERCSLWEEGQQYRMTVDVDSYPWKYRMLLHRLEQTWKVEPTASGTLLTLRFDGDVKLGLMGRMLVAGMSRSDRLNAILERYHDHITQADADEARS